MVQIYLFLHNGNYKKQENKLMESSFETKTQAFFSTVYLKSIFL